MNVENDRKHCALQISRDYFGACLPRHGASQTGGQKWRIVLKVLTSNLLEPSMSSVFNPYTYISRNTLIHTYYIKARVTEYKDQTSVLYSSSSSRVKFSFISAFFVAHSPLAKLPWRRKLFTVFLVIRQDKVCFDTCPIQLFFIMIVDVGTTLFQLKSTVIASIEYLY